MNIYKTYLSIPSVSLLTVEYSGNKQNQVIIDKDLLLLSISNNWRILPKKNIVYQLCAETYIHTDANIILQEKSYGLIGTLRLSETQNDPKNYYTFNVTYTTRPINITKLWIERPAQGNFYNDLINAIKSKQMVIKHDRKTNTFWICPYFKTRKPHFPDFPNTNLENWIDWQTRILSHDGSLQSLIKIINTFTNDYSLFDIHGIDNSFRALIKLPNDGIMKKITLSNEHEDLTKITKKPCLNKHVREQLNKETHNWINNNYEKYYFLMRKTKHDLAGGHSTFEEFLQQDYFSSLVRETSEELGLGTITHKNKPTYTFSSGVTVEFVPIKYNLYIAELSVR